MYTRVLFHCLTIKIEVTCMGQHSGFALHIVAMFIIQEMYVLVWCLHAACSFFYAKAQFALIDHSALLLALSSRTGGGYMY